MDLGKHEEYKNERSDNFTFLTEPRRVRDKVKKRRQSLTRHTGNSVQKNWTKFGVLCALQLVSGLAGWYDEPRPSNAKWCKEWKGTEWSDVDLTDLVRPTLEGLILTCRRCGRNFVLRCYTCRWQEDV